MTGRTRIWAAIQRQQPADDAWLTAMDRTGIKKTGTVPGTS